MPDPCAPPQGARFHGSDGTAHYEFQWDTSAMRPTPNPDGTTGWARVITCSSGEGPLPVGELCRLHLCAFNPCRAEWKPSKHGKWGKPVHIQRLDWKPPAGADAEAASKPPPASPPLPPPPAPPKEPVSPLTPPKESTAAVAAEAAAVADRSEMLWLLPPTPPEESPGPPALPGPPAREPLRQTSAAEPLATAVQPPRQAGAAVAAVAAQEPAAPFAEGKIMSRLLELAREIRRPRAYIGHSFFLCFALARECRPCVWEGKHRIDLINTYAPWATDKCAKPCAVDAVYCCVKSTGGNVQLMQVSEDYPLNVCNHYVGGAAMGCQGPAVAVPTIEGFYSSLGIALLGTICDGDCGIDVACQMLGLPQTASQRALLREEPLEHCSLLRNYY